MKNTLLAGLLIILFIKPVVAQISRPNTPTLTQIYINMGNRESSQMISNYISGLSKETMVGINKVPFLKEDFQYSSGVKLEVYIQKNQIPKKIIMNRLPLLKENAANLDFVNDSYIAIYICSPYYKEKRIFSKNITSSFTTEYELAGTECSIHIYRLNCRKEVEDFIKWDNPDIEIEYPVKHIITLYRKTTASALQQEVQKLILKQPLYSSKAEVEQTQISKKNPKKSQSGISGGAYICATPYLIVNNNYRISGRAGLLFGHKNAFELSGGVGGLCDISLGYNRRLFHIKRVNCFLGLGAAILFDLKADKNAVAGYPALGFDFYFSKKKKKSALKLEFKYLYSSNNQHILGVSLGLKADFDKKDNETVKKK